MPLHGLIAKSTDKYLNDVPLKLWDKLPYYPVGNMRQHGDYLTLAGKVCVYKAAARDWKENQK